eukprot:420875-Amphidinium_carterae.3
MSNIRGEDHVDEVSHGGWDVHGKELLAMYAAEGIAQVTEQNGKLWQHVSCEWCPDKAIAPCSDSPRVRTMYRSERKPNCDGMRANRAQPM